MNRFSFFILLQLLTPILAFAQFLPPNQPEQNACDALVICGNGFFSPYTYQGHGTVLDITHTPCDAPGLGAGEDNSMWLKLTISTPGTLIFKIKPVAVQDDYDWAVFNATNKPCNNLLPSDVIRCNFNNNQPVANNGITGLSLTATQTGVMAGTTGQPYCKFINAQVGEVYFIMINNFGVLGQGLTSGFSIDFTGSTATFNQEDHPKLVSILQSCNTKKEVTVQLNKPVKCNSIAANGSDFFLSPFGNILSASGINCNANGTGYTDKIKLVFTTNLPPGNYSLKAKIGTDGNTLLDLCNNPLLLPDSLNFTVPVLEKNIIDTICSLQLPYYWNGITITQAGSNVASKTYPNQTGCDSIVRLSLHLVDTIKSGQSISICPEELPYLWNGILLSSGGNQIAKFHTTSQAGCDSLVTLNLHVQQAIQQSFNLSGCGFVSFNQKTYFQSQSNILDTVKSNIGCDSIYATLNIIVHPVNPLVLTIDTAACGFLDYKGKHYEQSQTLRDTIRNQYDCDSIYKVTNITIYPNIAVPVTEYARGCDEVFFKGIQYTTDTNIVDTFYNILGCDSLIRTTKIRPEHFRLSLSILPEHPVKDVLIILKAQSNMPNFQVTAWKPFSSFLNQTAYEQQILADESTTYQVFGKSEFGCLDSLSKILTVDSLIPQSVMPNAFTPNGDGLNDVFKPNFFNETGYKFEEFRIYNRLGQLVYTAAGVLNAGWNGNYYNQDLPAEAGVYFYYIRISFVNGKKLDFKGDVTLIR